ncbi:MAG: VCBS repeat-containing protein [Acidobacteria bacterium]|nr:VCBS repeat-containing protein [Acidobacteriota bacterium]
MPLDKAQSPLPKRIAAKLARIPLLLLCCVLVTAQDTFLQRFTTFSLPAYRFLRPADMVATDFNQDGVPDLAVAGSLGITVLTGAGGIEFRPQRDYSAPMPVALVSADLDQDGNSDLVSASNNGLTLFSGAASGDLRPRGSVPIVASAAPDSITSLAAADFNSDGKPDLAAALSSGSVVLLEGDGAFRFQTRNPLLTRANVRNARIAVADVDGDGKQDIIAGHWAASYVSLYLGNGNGTFQSERVLEVCPDPAYVTVGELDRDGKPDLIVTSPSSGGPWLLPGNGDGTFRDPINFAWGWSRLLTIGDWNHDGSPDLAGAAPDAVNLSISIGSEDGTFPPPRNYPIGGDPTAAISADFDGDGVSDLAVANRQTSNIGIFLGHEDGTLTSGGTLGAFQPEAVLAGTFLGDDAPVLAVANSGTDELLLIPDPGQDTPGNVRHYPVGKFPTRVAAADFDGDGVADVAVINQNSKDLSILFGLPDGGLAAERRVALGNYPSGLAVADVNGDARPDVIALLPLAGTVAVLLGRGRDGFDPPAALAAQMSSISDQIHDNFAVADFTGDGKADILFGGSENGMLLFAGNGDGAFQDPVVVDARRELLTLQAADLNGDGKPDAAAFGLNGLQVFLSSDGELRLAGAIPTGELGYSRIASLVISDWNGDGFPDAALTSSVHPGFAVLMGNGDGSFQPARIFRGFSSGTASIYPRWVTSADLNRDGRKDLVLAGEDSALWIFWNDPDP